MAILTKTFHRESERVHHEHYQMNEELHALGIALDHLHEDFNDPANLVTAKEIQILAKNMAEELPTHFQREEKQVLSTVSEVSPELDSFAREMRRQHADLSERMTRFCHAIDQMGNPNGLAEAVEAVRKEGREFAQALTSHIAIEEQELKGFL